MQRVVFTPGHLTDQSSEEALRREQKVLDVRALMTQAEALERKGNTTAALAAYSAAIEREPKLLALVTGKARCLLQLGRLEESVLWFSEAMTMSPNNATALFNRAVVLQRLGRYRDAVFDYKRAAKIIPQNFKAHFNCSLALKRAGDLRGALEEINKALDIQRKNVDAMYNKANVLLALHEHRAAIGVLEEAGKIAPADKSIAEKLKAAREDLVEWERTEPQRRSARMAALKAEGKSCQLEGHFAKATEGATCAGPTPSEKGSKTSTT